ncbi:MAG: DUF4268 domain-containing protein, partial [Planctomycetota bacterium]
PELRLRTPRPQHWFPVAVGRSDCYVAMIVNSNTNKVGCELYIPHSKELYHTLHAQKAEIEKALDIAEPLDWQELPRKKASRIRVQKDFRFDDATTWETAFKWLIEMTIRFKHVFGKNWSAPPQPTSEGS